MQDCSVAKDSACWLECRSSDDPSKDVHVRSFNRSVVTIGMMASLAVMFSTVAFCSLVDSITRYLNVTVTVTNKIWIFFVLSLLISVTSLYFLLHLSQVIKAICLTIDPRCKKLSKTIVAQFEFLYLFGTLFTCLVCVILSSAAVWYLGLSSRISALSSILTIVSLLVWTALLVWDVKKLSTNTAARALKEPLLPV